MNFKIFVHKRLLESFDPALLAQIKQRFVAYKCDGIRHSTFGREVPYTRPQSVVDSNLWHIHLKDATSRNWSRPGLDYFYMTSDTALIYTTGARHPEYFLIISIIENAHLQYGGTEKYIREMADIARGFQKIY